MEKKLQSVSIIILFLLMFVQSGQSQLATSSNHVFGLLPVESFETPPFPPEGWSKITNFDGQGWRRIEVGNDVPGVANSTVDSPAGGENFVAMAGWWTGDADSSFNTDQQTDQWLITPQINSIEVGDSLIFYLRYVFDLREIFEVRLSRTDNDSTQFFDTTLVSITFNDESSNEWQRYSIPLSGFAGDSVYIAFRERVNSTFNEGAALLLDLVEVSSLVTSVADSKPLPGGFSLSQNYPNPFNPTTRIDYNLAREAVVTLQIHNLLGQVVRTVIDAERKSGGAHTVLFDASGLPNGVYYYKITAGDFVEVKKMTLMR